MEISLLKKLNEEGFVPGPLESEEDFLFRVEAVKAAFFKLGVRSIPESHWIFSQTLLQDLFGFTAKNIPAFYSNASLMPWQAACAWVERDQLIAIQLRKAFMNGSFLRLYERHEILAHEAVHAVRSAFPHDRFDEMFAYMTSQRLWIKVLGPIIKNPWEVWPFVVFCLLGVLDPFFFLGSIAWMFLGFFRLIKSRLYLNQAAKNLKRTFPSDLKVRSILVRLTESEIIKLAHKKTVFELYLENSQELRWQMIHLIYLQEISA